MEDLSLLKSGCSYLSILSFSERLETFQKLGNLQYSSGSSLGSGSSAEKKNPGRRSVVLSISGSRLIAKSASSWVVFFKYLGKTD